ncbi:TPA: helix-turn-helix domain-containing protein [Bacillus paranthracis]|uniref:helix-turn-helix domain-containing protein n=1 Tax=Bacillus cereus group TaxID=86661 RepID=UPI001E2F6508|nr:helix-turn-helix domain-containing protein [Bacillus paranthracis]MCC2374984.1 helix-turn-helix domain-containing protein [Bacillus paranthracis]HDR6310565.1 helix-turn-helix domain-containing protein [Bacillus cereus]HDR7278507.1 helix-turn-helix domain-containing protein [Bacillus paranthracis]
MAQLNKDYYSIKEASEILGRSIHTIHHHIRSKNSTQKINVKKINNRLFISKEDLIKYKQFIDERNSIVEIDCEYAMNKISNETEQNNLFRETRTLFIKYSQAYYNKCTGSTVHKQATIGQFINFHNKLQKNLSREIFEVDIEELNQLFLNEGLLTSKEKLLFTRFLSYVFTQKNMPLKNKLLAVQNKQKEQEIYSASTFNQIYKHVQNIELHIEKSLNSRSYANMWVYVTLLCCDFIRGSDLVLNTPSLNLKELNIQEADFHSNNFKLNEHQVQIVIKTLYFSFRNKRASKTGELLTFLVPSNLEMPLAHALVLSERLRENKTCQLETFIEGKYRKIKTQGGRNHLKFFNSYKKFEGFRFSSLIMNRSLATYLYGSVTEGNAFDSELALTLAQNARSHKNEDTTKTYIQLMNKDGSIGRVAINIFRRGNFGWLYDQLLRFTYTDNYKTLNLEDRTTIIEEIKEHISLKETESIAAYVSNYLTPASIEESDNDSVVKVMNAIYEKRLKVIHQVMRLNKQQLHDLFSELSTHSMPSKIEYAQCLVFPNCAYPALMNCMYCEYVLPQNLILIQLNQELLRLLTSIQENDNENLLKRQSRFLLQCLLILSEANDTFGKSYVKAYVDVNQVNDLLKQYAYKIYLPGDNYGD